MRQSLSPAADAGRTKPPPMRRSRIAPRATRTVAVGRLYRQDPEYQPVLKICFEVPEKYGPALRSAIEEISNEVGGRLEGAHRFAKEQALTDASVALGALRTAVNAKVPKSDPDYV